MDMRVNWEVILQANFELDAGGDDVTPLWERETSSTYGMVNVITPLFLQCL